MNAEEKWQAVCRCDGMFWYGVKSTGIFCNPSCKSRRPKKDNIVYFDSPQEAMDAGYRTCKRCRPDLQSYDPNRHLISHMKEVLDLNADNPKKLQEALKQIPMTPHHFNQLFKIRYGQTPHAYVLNKRLVLAVYLHFMRHSVRFMACHRPGTENYAHKGRPPYSFLFLFMDTAVGSIKIFPAPDVVGHARIGSFRNDIFIIFTGFTDIGNVSKFRYEILGIRFILFP